MQGTAMAWVASKLKMEDVKPFFCIVSLFRYGVRTAF